MIKAPFTIVSHKEIALGVYELVLSGNTSGILRPGQFVNLSLDGFFLRRPFAVADRTEETFTILYKVVGRGTRTLGQMKPGHRLDVLTGLGNGFDAGRAGGNKVLLAAGGMGLAPLFYLGKELAASGVEVCSVMGFNTAADVCYDKEFGKFGEVRIATMDGSTGIKGFVTDAMKGLDFDLFYACGPLPMERALCLGTEKPGQVSLEARMGCGTGICMGCTVFTRNGPRRVCADGPVFDKEDLIW